MLSHEVHLTVALVKVFICFVVRGFVFVESFTVLVSDDAVQVNPISEFLTILIGAIPFKFGYVPSYTQSTELLFRYIPNYFAR